MLQGDDGAADPVDALGAAGRREGEARTAGRERRAAAEHWRYALSAAGISDSMNFDARCAWRFIA